MKHTEQFPVALDPAAGQAVAAYDENRIRGNASDEDEIDLRALWQIVLRYRKLIGLIFTVMVVTSLIITLLLRPMYTATVSLEINTSGRNIVKFQNVENQDLGSHEYIGTQSKILASTAVAKEVIRSLALTKEPEFNGELKQRGLISGFKSLVNVFRSQDDDLDEASLLSSAANIYSKRLSIGSVRNTSLVNISVSSFTPELAAKMADEHAIAYIRLSDDRRFNSTSGAKLFLEKELSNIQARLETSEKQLNSFARKNGVIDVEDRNNIMMARLGDLNKSLSEVQSERINAETKTIQAQTANPQTLMAVYDDLLIKTLREEQVGLKAEYFKLSKIYKPKFPQMLQLDANIADIELSIQSQANKIIAGLTTNYEQLNLREDSLTATLEGLKEQLLNLQDRAVTYNILKREWEANKELYSGLLERTKEVGVAAGMELNIASVVDSASIPGGASSPNLKLNLLIAAFLGLATGLGAAFLLAMLDNTINDVEQLNQITGMGHLGIAPEIDLDEQLVENESSRRKMMDTILHHDPGCSFSESIQSVRTSLSYARAGGFPKTIMLTSSLAGEGKSTLCMNLAISCANAGKRVVVIETDLRRSRLYKIFGVPQSPGLADYLVGSKPAVPYTVAQIPNLSILVAGSKTPNPVDLLGSVEMQKLINDYSEQYDLVLFDSPPVLMLADSVVLSRMVEAVLFIVSAHSTPRDAVKNSINRLRMAGAPLVGTVLNRVQSQHSGYYYDYMYQLADNEVDDAPS